MPTFVKNAFLNINNISVNNFRNYNAATFEFCDGVNCISGLNGTGKTNLLEAIYYLCVGKGYFTNGELYNIRKGEISFDVTGNFKANGYDDCIRVIYKNADGKTILRNELKYQRIAEHVGRYPIMVIEPDDTIIIAEGGEVRRKLIDNVVSQVDKLYLDNLIQYNKVLSQRNALLKTLYESKTANNGLIDVYDEQLTSFGKEIFNHRKNLVNEIKPYINDMYHKISGGKEKINMNYDSDLIKHNLKELLLKNRNKDLILQRTTSGIHKDDYDLLLQNVAVKKFGSQGQKKSVMISLKLALYQWIKDKKQVLPILLLDDIFDKLDDERVANLFGLVNSDTFGQVFITDTDEARLRNRFKNCIKEVKFIQLPDLEK